MKIIKTLAIVTLLAAPGTASALDGSTKEPGYIASFFDMVFTAMGKCTDGDEKTNS